MTMRLRFRLLPDIPEIGWTPYVWLIYLLPFIAFGIWQRPTPLKVGLTIATTVVFLALYFLGYWLKRGRLVLCAASILLLGVLFAPSNPGSSSFFVYAAACLGHVEPPRLVWRLLGVLLLVLVGETWLLHLTPYFWVPAVVFSLLIGGINLHSAEVGRANARLRVTQAEVERLAQTAERERIGRDLHDLLGHTLSLITLKAELARKLVPRDPERAAREMEELETISRDALREVREVVGGYRSVGLAAEMARARLALDAAGVSLEYLALPVDLDPAQETVLAFALREAVTNVIRHARAGTCWITLEPLAGEAADEGGTCLQVRDDGKGGVLSEGTGLTSMRDRVEGLGGRLDRTAEGGTGLVITLPARRRVVAEATAGGDLAAGSLAAEPAG